MIGRVIYDQPLAYGAMAAAYGEQLNESEQAREGYAMLQGGQIVAGTNHGATTVAAGSNGGNIANIATWGAGFGGNGVLNIASVPGTLGATGQVAVATNSAQGWAIVAYTGTSGGNSLTGCTLVAGSGTIVTGNNVIQATVKLNAGAADFDGLLTTWTATDNIPFLDAAVSGTPVLNVTGDVWVVFQVAKSGSVTLVLGSAGVPPTAGAASWPDMPAAATTNIANIGLAWGYVPSYTTPGVNGIDTAVATLNTNAKIMDARVIERRSLSGWIADTSAAQPWTQTSATTFTVPQANATRFGIGVKLRWAISGVLKYGYVKSVGAPSGGLVTVTLVTETTYSGMSATPDAYSCFYCGTGTRPGDFPATFSYTVTVANATGGTISGSFWIDGNVCYVHIATGTNWSMSSSTSFNVSLPLAPPRTTYAAGLRFNQGGTALGLCETLLTAASTTAAAFKYDNSNMTSGAQTAILGDLAYAVA